MKERQLVHFRGTCDACGETITYVWDRATGVIDYTFNDDGKLLTWIRHIKGTDPKCRIYSSVVTEVERKAAKKVKK